MPGNRWCIVGCLFVKKRGIKLEIRQAYNKSCFFVNIKILFTLDIFVLPYLWTIFLMLFITSLGQTASFSLDE